jgi:SAM-dependent methyltransferase
VKDEDASIWTSRDPGISLFVSCLDAGAPIEFKPGMRVLEVGCCEADWLHVANKEWPEVEFVGIDHRAVDETSADGKVQRWKGNVMDPELFEANSFDAVVSLSTIEHIGLGHYDHDPVDKDGDSKAVANIWRWLKPGGVFYFDVPYNPEEYSVMGTECRIYDDVAVFERLGGRDWRGPIEFTGYCDSKSPSLLIEKPTVAAPRYYYVAMVWRKA